MYTYVYIYIYIYTHAYGPPSTRAMHCPYMFWRTTVRRPLFCLYWIAAVREYSICSHRNLSMLSVCSHTMTVRYVHYIRDKQGQGDRNAVTLPTTHQRYM